MVMVKYHLNCFY